MHITSLPSQVDDTAFNLRDFCLKESAYLLFSVLVHISLGCSEGLLSCLSYAQMHSLLLPPRSILATFNNQQQHASFLPSTGFHEMLGKSDDAQEGNDATSPGPASKASPSSGDPHQSSLARTDTFASLEDLVAECGLAIAEGRWQRSIQLISYLRQRAVPDGDSIERVVSHFVDTLAAIVVSKLGESQASRQLLAGQQNSPSSPLTEAELQAAYLSLNQVTPFIRFTHLTANQAILEALQGWDAVHIVDMEIMQGVQWPPLMQALADRVEGPPKVRITGIGSNLALLEQTGNRLSTFAASLSLPMFEFHAVHAATNAMSEILTPGMLGLRDDEALAINISTLQLKYRWRCRQSFLTVLRSLQPTILTIADREVNYGQAFLVDRLMHAFKHFCALFDSLEATLPPSSVERSSVESVWLRGEIKDLLTCAFPTQDNDEGQSLLDSQCFRWREQMGGEGFQLVSYSAFAASQARLLLRLHYPSQGYELNEDGDILLLGWQGTPLFSVSAWICAEKT